MEFVAQREDLAWGIATVERAVPSRDSDSLLQGIYIKAEGDRLLLLATDRELSIECYVPAQIKEEGTTALTGRVFGQIVRKVSGETIKLTMEDRQIAQVESGRSRFSVHAMDAQDFPIPPAIVEPTLWRLPQSDLRRMIGHTLFAAASDESRPYLTGVLFETEGDEITLVATDSSRLSHFKGRLTEANAEQGMTAILPANSMAELQRILDDEADTDVELALTSTQAVFSVDGVRLISRVIEGKFPDYRQVFPKDNPVRFRTSRQEFLAAVERVSLIARRNTPIVRVRVEENTLFLTTSEAEVGQAFEEVPVAQEGSDHETAYQARYLIDALRAMDSDEVEMELGEGLRQGCIRPVDDEGFTYIVMPVRVG